MSARPAARRAPAAARDPASGPARDPAFGPASDPACTLARAPAPAPRRAGAAARACARAAVALAAAAGLAAGAAAPTPAAAAGSLAELPAAAAAAMAAAGWAVSEDGPDLVLARGSIEIRAALARTRPAARGGGAALRLEDVRAAGAAGGPERGAMTARRLYLSDLDLLALGTAGAAPAPCGGLPARPMSASFWDLVLVADADALPGALAGPERLTATRLTLTAGAEPWREGCRIDLLADIEGVTLSAATGAAARIGRIALRLSGAAAGTAPVVLSVAAEAVDLRLPGGAPLARADRLTLAIDSDAAAAGALAADAPWQRLATARLAVALTVLGLATEASAWLDPAPDRPPAPAYAAGAPPPPSAAGAAAPPQPPHGLAGDLSLALGLAQARLSVAATAEVAGALALDAALEATLGTGGEAGLAGTGLPPALAGAGLEAARLAWADRGLDRLLAAASGRGVADGIAAAEAALVARAPAPARPLLAALTAPAAAFLARGVDGPVAARLAPDRPVTVPALLRTLLIAPGRLAGLLGVEVTAGGPGADVTPP